MIVCLLNCTIYMYMYSASQLETLNAKIYIGLFNISCKQLPEIQWNYKWHANENHLKLKCINFNCNIILYCTLQYARKVLFNSVSLVDFAIGLENSVINLSNGHVKFFRGNSNYRRTVVNAHHKLILHASWNDI